MSVMETSGRDSSKKRKHEDDLVNRRTKPRRTDEGEHSASEVKSRESDSPIPQKKHSKKERKQNRSTRIHSLRKLIARGTLPSNVKQEKERELAALLHEQNKTKTKKEARKTLERYHYVRFIERQKAEKRLRQLRKQLQAKGKDKEISKEIHAMEVTRNYAIYAPLDQKYISIFVSKVNDENVEDDELRVVDVSRPIMWYTVETAMLQGQPALETLRDSKTRSNTVEEGDYHESHQKQKLTTRSNARSKGARSQDLSDPSHQSHETIGQSVRLEPAGDMSDGGFFEK